MEIVAKPRSEDGMWLYLGRNHRAGARTTGRLVLYGWADLAYHTRPGTRMVCPAASNSLSVQGERDFSSQSRSYAGGRFPGLRKLSIHMVRLGPSMTPSQLLGTVSGSGRRELHDSTSGQAHKINFHVASM